MDTTTTKTKQNKPANVSTSGLRVRKEWKRKIVSELAKINKKDFGRKVRFDDLLEVLWPFLNETLIKQVQERTMSNSDRLEKQYAAYVLKFGSISKDEYLGKLLTANVHTEVASK